MSAILLALAILVAGAIGSLLLGKLPRLSLAVGLGAAVAAGGLCVVTACRVLTSSLASPTASINWPLPLGSAQLALDGLSAWFLLMLGMLVICIGIYSWGYLQEEIKHGVPIYAALLCVQVAALIIVFCASDAVLFLFGWEMMSLSAFFLVGWHDRDPDVSYGAWIYLITTHVGTIVMLLPMFGIVIVRASSGHGNTLVTGFSSFAPALATASPGLLSLLFILGLVGFGAKAGFMPVHIWLPRAHSAAPSPVSALMSGIVIKTGIYGLLRLITWLGPLPRGCAAVMLVVAMVSGILGVLYALGQRHIKRMLAYSSIENIGIIGLGIGMGMAGRTMGGELGSVISLLGFAGALLHALNHALFKGLLFLGAGAVIHSTGTGEMDRLGGLIRRLRWTAPLFLIGTLAICALPPLNGFLGEWFIYRAFFSGAGAPAASSAWLPVCGLAALALIGGLALSCFAGAFGMVFLGQQRDDSIRARSTPAMMILGMLPLAAACLTIGLCGPFFTSILSHAVAPIVPASTIAQIPADTGLGALANVVPVIFVFLVMIVLLYARTRFPARQKVARQSTWGCGYAYPHPRMQYTSSSFGWTLVQTFHRFLPSRRSEQLPQGYFPVSGSISTELPDAAETYFFARLIRSITRFFQRFSPWQYGRVQLYLIYMVATLLLVFFIEAVWSPLPGQSAVSTPPAHVSPDPVAGAGVAR